MQGARPGATRRRAKRSRPVPRSRRTAPPVATPHPEPVPFPGSGPARFRSLDRYRVEREWARYEGTAQRRLWRELRERFLERHARNVPWSLDLGSGPGRFTPWAGGPTTRSVVLDLSVEMLRAVPRYWKARHVPHPFPDRVRADAARPPFRPAAFGKVVALGNLIGFAEGSSDRLLEEAAELVGPDGTLLLEVAPGPGERSRYLARLPVSSVGRLFRAPVAALLPRIAREGFDPEPPRRPAAGSFRRISAEEVSRRLEGSGWTVSEIMAVAPALGPEPRRIQASAADPKAWAHLLEVEEALGHRPERWTRAAAVLLAAVRTPRR